MKNVSFAHLSDGALLAELKLLLARERSLIAQVIAHLAEFDARKLYVPAGYPSMHRYCVGELRFSDDAAYKRIQVARASRQFPALLDALADGRLHLSGATLLCTHLDEANAEALIAAASGRSKFEIEQRLAERFPCADLTSEVLPIGGAMSAPEIRQLAPGQVVEMLPTAAAAPAAPGAPVPTPPARVKPLAPERFGLQVTLSRETYELMRRAQELSGETSNSALEAFLAGCFAARVTQLERRKLGATSRPRARRSDGATRYVPSEVRREVTARDGGRCTFVSADGHRCEERSRLEFDHVTPVGSGGRSTTANLRLRCRAHNAWEAERAYGAEFMRQKREAARAEAAAKAEAAAAQVRAAAESREAAERAAAEVLPWLRQLGVTATDARRAIERAALAPTAPLQERVRAALRQLAPTSARVSAAPA